MPNLRPGRCPQGSGQRANWVPPQLPRTPYGDPVETQIGRWQAYQGLSHTAFPGDTQPPLGLPEEVCVGGAEPESSPPSIVWAHQHRVSVNLRMGTGRIRCLPACPQSLSEASSEETVTRTMGGGSPTGLHLLVPRHPHPHTPWALKPGPWQSAQGPNSVETGLLTSTHTPRDTGRPQPGERSRQPLPVRPRWAGGGPPGRELHAA